MQPAEIASRTTRNLTRTCQVNTLTYLIKTNESQAEVERIDHSSTTSLIDNKTTLTKELLSTEKAFNIKHKRYDQGITMPAIELEEDDSLDNLEQKSNDISSNNETRSINRQADNFIFKPSPLKCINTYDNIDFDEPNVSITASVLDNNMSPTRVLSDEQNQNNNQTSKLFRSNINHYRIISRKRRQYRNKKQTSGFLRRLYRQKKAKHHCKQILTTQSNDTSLSKSIIDLDLNTSEIISQYKLHNYTRVARASKNSSACKELQTLINNPETSLAQLIDSQLRLTSNENYRSVCILIDDQKQSEEYRSSVLHYIYTTLSNTLKNISRDNNSIQIKCMNLVFFQNSLCDIIHMRRLRLIDTGRLKHPSFSL